MCRVCDRQYDLAVPRPRASRLEATPAPSPLGNAKNADFVPSFPHFCILILCRAKQRMLLIRNAALKRCAAHRTAAPRTQTTHRIHTTHTAISRLQAPCRFLCLKRGRGDKIPPHTRTDQTHDTQKRRGKQIYTRPAAKGTTTPRSVSTARGPIPTIAGRDETRERANSRQNAAAAPIQLPPSLHPPRAGQGQSRGWWRARTHAPRPVVASCDSAAPPEPASSSS